MNARMAAVLDETNRARNELMERLDGVPHDQLQRVPAGGGWSVAQVLEHLLLVEQGSVRLLAKLLRKAVESGLSEATAANPVADDRVTLPSQSATAPEIVQPGDARAADVVLSELATSRAALEALADEAARYDVAHVRARHLLLGELHFYQWVSFLGEHERRHTRQIERILAALAP